jgi:hypothetical protein
MKILLRLSLVALALAFLMPLATSNVSAQGKHPYYLHALSDLRTARAHLQHPDGGAVRMEETAAIEDIDKAINEIKRASIDDGKNIDDHVPVDKALDWPGRLHRAKELVEKAHQDASHEEDDPAARGLQARVIDHIDKAHHHIDEAIAVAEAH